MKILVTGSNGLLGQKLTELALRQPDVEWVATSRGENRLHLQGDYRYRSLDITRQEEVEKCLSEEKPEVVINTAAMTNVDQCEDDREGCDALNVQAVEYLAHACRQNDIHLVHVSTDFIFDGEDGPYREEDPPNPLSYYGASKLKGEQIVERADLSYSIVRTVLVYGVAADLSRSNIVLWAKKALESGQKINVVDDQYRTPTLAEDLAAGCLAAARQKAQGIYNISGSDLLSILEIVWAVADFWQLDKSLITAVSSTTLNQKAPRPPKTGFVLEKAQRELNYRPKTFREGLAVVDQQLKQRR